MPTGMRILGWLAVAVILTSPARAEDQKSEKNEGALEEELDELQEDDYPDLVGKDDESELMDEFALLMEEDIVYAASKHQQDIAESPSAITVITREQIENTWCTDLVCLLRQVPEVDVLRVMPMFASVGCRALTGEVGDKVLALVDGREINIEFFGVPFWQAVPLNLEDIERIEVIRGPGSALYGANAHSMVVSITTRKATESGTEVFYGSGEHDRNSMNLRVSQVFGGWRLLLSGGVETADHWRRRDASGRRDLRVRARVDHQGDLGDTMIHLGLSNPEGVLYTAFLPARTRNTLLGHVLLTHQVDWLRAQVYMTVLDADMVLGDPLYYQELKMGQFPPNFHFSTSTLDTEVQATLEPFGGNLLIAGGNYRWIAFTSDANRPGEINQHRVGLFLHDEQRLGKDLLLTGGLRFDYNSLTPWVLSPRLAMVWRFTGSQHLRLAFGRAFRKPSLYNSHAHFTGVVGESAFPELGDFFLDNFGNEDLDNESITVFEIGYRGRFLEGRLNAEAGMFFNLYRDTISFVTEMAVTNLGMPDLSRSQMEYRNAGREVNSLGGSVSLVYRVKQSLLLGVNYTFRHSWYVTEPGESAMEEAGKGERVPWEPAHLANLTFHYFFAAGLRVGAGAHFASSTDNVMPEHGGFFDGPASIHAPPLLFFSGFAAWRIPVSPGWIEVGIRAYNLTGVGFRDSPSAMRPDGVEIGGELLGRRMFLYLRGSI